jgi:regulator of sigma E protease
MYIVGFLLVLGPLITVHEFGHYLVGRLFGVKAEAFSIGFGKELFGRTDRRGTRWKLSALPLGGYVQFKGDMNPASIPDEEALAQIPEGERHDAFHFKPLWQRALIVAAGPVTNLIVAIAILAGFAMAYGKELPADPADQNYIAAFAEVSPAREAGMRIGDRIAAIDGEPMRDYRQVQRRIHLHPGDSIAVTVERGDERLTIPVTVRGVMMRDGFGNASTIGLIGIESRETERRFEPVGPVEAVGLAGRQTAQLLDMMVTGIVQIFAGDRSLKELGGPIKIAKFSGEQLSLGPDAFIWFVALISLNLAFINLLPIPALDGGHLAFYAAEAVRRKPVGPRGQELAFRTGIALVLMLMLFVTVNDVISLPVFGG